MAEGALEQWFAVTARAVSALGDSSGELLHRHPCFLSHTPCISQLKPALLQDGANPPYFFFLFFVLYPQWGLNLILLHISEFVCLYCPTAASCSQVVPWNKNNYITNKSLQTQQKKFWNNRHWLVIVMALLGLKAEKPLGQHMEGYIIVVFFFWFSCTLGRIPPKRGLQVWTQRCGCLGSLFSWEEGMTQSPCLFSGLRSFLLYFLRRITRSRPSGWSGNREMLLNTRSECEKLRNQSVL